ncbi:MAG: hypothetical protein AUG81_13120 [Verrucomicrobia bacterium 13_1_20CM_4_54_11]|nr:MAG: hypothetical protein AUG81_13120 [Verrucomicrobia bacterium 13_1_20CM_4_54_11]
MRKIRHEVTRKVWISHRETKAAKKAFRFQPSIAFVFFVIFCYKQKRFGAPGGCALPIRLIRAIRGEFYFGAR